MEKIYIKEFFEVGGVYMDIQNMKNMVVLKDLPSNLIEEAFVVLKDNVKVHKEELVGKKKEDCKIDNIKNKDYVIKEAEMIVAEYISKIETKEFRGTKEKIKLEEKCKKLKYSTIFFAMFSSLSVISMLLR